MDLPIPKICMSGTFCKTRTFFMPNSGSDDHRVYRRALEIPGTRNWCVYEIWQRPDEHRILRYDRQDGKL